MKAKKSLGQNFLTHTSTLEKIAGQALPGILVLEVGPGKGALTQKLLSSGLQVLAVEKDEQLVEHLREKFAPAIRSQSLILVSGDILHLDIPLLVGYEPYQIIANIPYYITGHFMRMVLESDALPQCMVLLLQLEVVDRMLARDGKHSLLSLSVQAFGQVSRLCKVPAHYFKPSPKVDSAVVRIDDISTSYFEDAGITPEQFFALIRQGFSSKRKTFVNNMKAHKLYSTYDWAQILETHKIDKRVRAEDISLEDWAKLVQATHLSRGRE
ncbi:MAG: 16S rRNA (adenine(1518)-N(6)/adenine(1519)-N(6))-dimethyltransferase RsmA [Patescibacteria group bacterium]